MKVLFKSKFVLSTVVLFSLSLGFIFLSQQSWFRSSYLFTSGQELVSTVNAWFAKPRQFFFELSEELDSLLITHEENKLLKRKLSDFEEIESRDESLSAENASLRSSLALSEAYSNQTRLVAEVLDRSPASWNQTLLISKGEDSGLTKNSLALANGGLVGFISEVGFKTSTVQLFMDDTVSYALAVKIGKTSPVYGILSSYDRNKGTFLISQLNQKEGIEPGDEVVTSDLSATYPSNLLLGEVLEIKENQDTLETEVFVKPAADFSDIYSLALVGAER